MYLKVQWALLSQAYITFTYCNFVFLEELSDGALEFVLAHARLLSDKFGITLIVKIDLSAGCFDHIEDLLSIFVPLDISLVTNGKLETNPPELMREKLREDEIHLIKSGQQEKNFIDAIYTNAENISPIPAGFSSVLPAVLAHIGMRTGQSKLRWDAAKGRFIDNPEADRYLTPHMRGDWTLAI